MTTLTRLLACLLACIAPLAAQGPIDVDRVSDVEETACVDWLKKHGQSPVDYVVGKFAHHDVVMLGETHAIRDHCELVIRLIDPLYRRAGVRVLASEFLRSRNTDRANRLVTAEKYDAALAIELFREGPWPTWGYKEYMDILHAVWKLNHGLPSEAKKMRVVGIDSDWEQHALWFKLNRGQRFKVLLAREKNMVEQIETEALAKKEKVLVHVGFSHTLTCQGVKLGTVLTRNHGAKIFQIGVHQDMGRGARLHGFLEEMLVRAGGKPMAFDIAGSPLAALRDRNCRFWRMKKDARFEDMTQGYLYLRPLADLRKVTWVPGFINDAMFEKAQAVAVKLRWAKKGECKNAAELDRKIAERFATP